MNRDAGAGSEILADHLKDQRQSPLQNCASSCACWSFGTKILRAQFLHRARSVLSAEHTEEGRRELMGMGAELGRCSSTTWTDDGPSPACCAGMDGLNDGEDTVGAAAASK